jgi:sigma-B regulation protein RsbU (phosphoserine phosphatase)
VSAQTPSLLLVGCDPGCRAALGAAGMAAVAVAGPAEALAWLGRSSADAVLMAARPSGADAAQAVRRLAEAHPDLAILAWTRADEAAEARAMIEAGALDRLDPDAPPPALAQWVADLVADHRAQRRLAKRRRAWLGDSSPLDARHRLEDELHLAWTAQKSLLPDATLIDDVEAAYDVAISAHVEPSSELGGDLWGVTPIDDWSFALCIADFSGHGMAAALNTFRLHALIREIHQEAETPGAVLAALNIRLAGQLPVGQFATMLYGIVDTAHDRFDYASAGAPAPVAVDTLSGDLMVGDGTGLPLGIAAKVRYPERRLHLPADGLLMLASDALAECPDRMGQALGRSGAADLLRRAVLEEGGPLTVGTILEPFLKTVRRPMADDLTVVCCQRHGAIG